MRFLGPEKKQVFYDRSRPRDAQPCKHPIECVDDRPGRPVCHSCGERLCQYCKTVAIPKTCNTCAQCADERGP